MSLQTKIRETKHYIYRVTTCERLDSEDIKYANKTFDHIMKKIRKGRIKPFPGNKPGTMGVYFRGLVFIYYPNPDGTYTLITAYDKFKKQDQDELITQPA